MSKCGVFSPAATDADMHFRQTSPGQQGMRMGSPHYRHYVKDEYVGRLRGTVFVGAMRALLVSNCRL